MPLHKSDAYEGSENQTKAAIIVVVIHQEEIAGQSNSSVSNEYVKFRESIKCSN